MPVTQALEELAIMVTPVFLPDLWTSCQPQSSTGPALLCIGLCLCPALIWHAFPYLFRHSGTPCQGSVKSHPHQRDSLFLLIPRAFLQMVHLQPLLHQLCPSCHTICFLRMWEVGLDSELWAWILTQGRICQPPRKLSHLG